MKCILHVLTLLKNSTDPTQIETHLIRYYHRTTTDHTLFFCVPPYHFLHSCNSLPSTIRVMLLSAFIQLSSFIIHFNPFSICDALRIDNSTNKFAISPFFSFSNWTSRFFSPYLFNFFLTFKYGWVSF